MMNQRLRPRNYKRDRGPAPDPGSVTRGGPKPRAAPSQARCARLGPLYGNENKILVWRRVAVQTNRRVTAVVGGRGDRQGGTTQHIM